jgi:Tfp pilus assembly protein PilN
LFEKPFNDFLRTLPENAQGRDEVNSILFLVIEYLKCKGIEKSLLESKKMIPDYMKPRRHRFLKNLYWFTAAASIVIAVAFGIRHSSKSYAEYSNLKSYNSRLETELTSLKKEHAILLKKETQLKKLLESTPGCPHILHILSDMTRKIPSYMWVTSFNSSGDILNITLSSDKDSTDIYRQLSSAKSFEVINLRKRKTYNKKFAYYIKLRSKLNNEL